MPTTSAALPTDGAGSPPQPGTTAATPSVAPQTVGALPTPQLSPGPDSVDAADVTAQPISLAIGQASATAQVAPDQGAVIELATDDGSDYLLDIPALAVVTPTQVTLRQLSSATIPGLTFAGGVEIEPVGLHLQLPATLTMSVAADLDPATEIAISFSDTAESAQQRGRLSQLGPASAIGGVSILLTHFSGGAVGSLDPTGESLWLQKGTFNTDTVDGRQAQAEHGIAVYDWAEQQGKIDHDTAEAGRQIWRQQWQEAERDRLAGDMKPTIDGGDISDAQAVIDQASKMVKVGLDIGQAGDAAAAEQAINQAVQLIGQYGLNAINRLNQDPAFQQKLDAGLVSNMGEIFDAINTLLGIARSQELIGATDTGQKIEAATRQWLDRLVNSILESCKHAPLDVSLTLGLLRTAELLGDSSAKASLADCIWDDTHLHITGSFHGSQPGGTSESESIDLHLEIPADLIRTETDTTVAHPIIGWVDSYSLGITGLVGCDGCVATCNKTVPDAWTGLDTAQLDQRLPGHVRLLVQPDIGRLGRGYNLCVNPLGPYLHYDMVLVDLEVDEYGAVTGATAEPAVAEAGVDYGLQVTVLPPVVHE